MQIVQPLFTVLDGYTYFRCPRTAFVTLKVYNNGVDVGFGVGFPQADYPAGDEYYALENATLPRLCDEIRFKNHVAGSAAQIQITCQQSADLPSGNPLAVGSTPNFLTIDAQGRPGATFAGKIKASELDLQVSPNAAPINWVNAAGGVLATITGDANGNLTLGPGTVTLSGQIHAQGLTLDAPLAVPISPVYKVRWLRVSDGGLVADQSAYSLAGTSALVERAIGVASTDTATLLLEAISGSALGGNTTLKLLGDPVNDTGSAGTLQVADHTGAQSAATLLDATGGSSFIQTASRAVQHLSLSGGQINPVTWPGASRLSNVMSVAHGLGRSPIASIAQGSEGGVGLDIMTTESWTDVNNIYIRVGFDSYQPPAGNNGFASWLVIG